MIWLLLAASIANAQTVSTDTASIPLLDQIQISNLGKDTRDLLSGRYRQTGKPTFANGFCFADATCQAGAGGVLTATQTFSGANTFTNPVVVSTSLPKTSVPAANAIYSENIAKAWAVFTGTATVAVQEGFGIASVATTATGSFTVTFARAFLTANYMCVCGGPHNSGTGRIACGEDDATPKTTTVLVLRTWDASSGAAVSPTKINLVCYGKQ